MGALQGVRGATRVSFTDDVVAAGKRKGPQCSAGVAAAKLPPGEADEMEACLLDDRFTDAQVRQALLARGLDVGAHVLSRHRRRLCQCPPWEPQT